ncbi:hypothetical protein LB577_30015 [Mesorhizobium sp. B283B1A]|uniref:hypothetical protein n=1 Tax=Mesorhizobium TaxID=68287 RepID=UPI001CD054E5|nr:MULTISPECIES: hypothetical protein [Mesorhizobium]MCA0051147.1 hypothetical protein [Mesorhizobium sp. B283B1A]UQS68219.1 hypothetical protein M5D98_31795 [Mesorhizobium opportunistum]
MYGANDDDRILAFTDEGTLIAHRHLTIRKLQRSLHGQSSEPSARLHDQMELDPHGLLADVFARIDNLLPVELEIRKTADPTSCGLIMPRNKVHHDRGGQTPLEEKNIAYPAASSDALALATASSASTSAARAARLRLWPAHVQRCSQRADIVRNSVLGGGNHALG